MAIGKAEESTLALLCGAAILLGRGKLKVGCRRIYGTLAFLTTVSVCVRIYTSHRNCFFGFTFHDAGIAGSKFVRLRGTHSNEKNYNAIANGVVNCGFIQAFHKVCFINYIFEILMISSFVLICSMLCVIFIINTFFWK